MKLNPKQLKQHLKPTIISAGRFILLSAITYGPGGIAGFAVKSVARRPLKIALGLVLEPLLKRVMTKFVTPVLKRTEKSE